jgi:regulator of CtrA degradation
VSETATAFFSRTYDEAFELLVEARNYVAFEEHGDRENLGLFDRLTMSCETMRMTARITHVMSWLLFQKAVHAGEIAMGPPVPDEVRLGGHHVCMTEEEGGEFPPRLSALLDRSRKLYVRVARLDQLMARA